MKLVISHGLSAHRSGAAMFEILCYSPCNKVILKASVYTVVTLVCGLYHN